MSRNPLFHALRHETASAHERLEQLVDLTWMTSHRDHYVAALGGFFGIWQPWEVVIAKRLGTLDSPPEMETRWRAGKAESDLQALGVASAGIPRTTRLPDLRSQAELIGTLYVMEGSSLGGQIICREVREKLGFTPERGASFFWGNGQRTGELWKLFSSWASERDSLIDRAACVGAAVHAFELMGGWFAERLDRGDDRETLVEGDTGVGSSSI